MYGCYWKHSVALSGLDVSVALPASSELLFPSLQVTREYHMFLAFVDLVDSTSNASQS